MKLTYWLLREGETNIYRYRLQADDVKRNTEKKLFKILENEWNLVGEAWYSKNERKCYLFQKTFNTEKEVQNYFSSFPYSCEKMSSTSEKVQKINNKKAKKTTKNRKQNQCKICNQIGHNSRTCQNKAK